MTKKEPAKKAPQNKKTPPAKKDKQANIVADNIKLKLKLSWSDVESEYNQILKALAKNTKAQGFRKGKVPLKIAEEKIGRERLINKTLETLIPPRYDQLIEKEGKRPLTQPQITPLSMKWGQDWELEIQIAEKPSIKLGNYQKAVKKGLKSALEQLKKQTKAEKKSTSAKKDGSGAKSTPKLSPEQLAAREKEIKLHQVFKSLVESIKPQIPELLLKEETKREIQRMAKELEKMGLSLDDYLARRGQKFEEMSAQIAAQVLGQLQLEFILREIEAVEKIAVTAKDTQAELNKIEDKAMRAKIESNPHYLDHLNKQISRRLLIDLLLEIK